MSRTRTQKRRLLKLADFLENEVKDERFDLDIIAETETCELPSQTSCGTAACAIGHMPQVFPRSCQYSKIPDDCFELDWQGQKIWGKDNPFSLAVEGKKEFEGKDNFDLAHEFFGLNPVEASYLFLPNEYNIRKGRKTVARRIRKFVEEGRILKDHDAYKRAVDEGYYENE